MNTKKDIQLENEELKKEFPLLFSVEKKNPFSAPANYFDELDENLSLRLGAEQQINFNEETDVPSNYFAELENKIKNKIELDKIKNNAFETPVNYFNDLEDDVKRNILLQNLKFNSFATPSNYFDESASTIKTEIYLRELKNVNVFVTPTHYFENFETRLRSNLNQKPEVKVINLFTYVKKVKYYAAAAAMVGICFLAYFIFNTAKPMEINAPAQLSALDKQKVIANPAEFGIDENAVIDLVNENPELLASNDVVPDEVSDEAMNEIVLDNDVDVNTIIGEN